MEADAAASVLVRAVVRVVAVVVVVAAVFPLVLLFLCCLCWSSLPLFVCLSVFMPGVDYDIVVCCYCSCQC